MTLQGKTLEESFGEKVRAYKESLRYSKRERNALVQSPVADPVGSIEDTTPGARDNFVFVVE